MDGGYPFADGDRLEDRNTYFYVPYGGKDFMAAWRRQRDTALADLPEPADPEIGGGEKVPEAGPVTTTDLLEALHGALAGGRAGDTAVQGWLEKLVKKFEVTKHIHPEYDAAFRALDRNAYGDLSLYVRLVEVFEAAFAQSRDLIFLNLLLKCLDSLCSVKDRLSEEEQARLARLIGCEDGHVRTLQEAVSSR